MTDIPALARELGLTINQTRNGLGILVAVKDRQWGQHAGTISVEVALAESGMRILASANVPNSQRYPHDLLGWTYDGLGHDHASMGMFQQQTGYAFTPAGYGWNMNQTTMNSPFGWGRPYELMNAVLSTKKFLDALSHVDWRNQAAWVAGQNVQHSAYDGNPRAANNYSGTYGGNYQGQHERAKRIVAVLWPHAVHGVLAPHQKPHPKPARPVPAKPTRPTRPTKPTRPGGATRPPTVAKRRTIATYTVRRGDTLATIARRYSQRDVTWATIARDNRIKNPNLITVGQQLTIKSGV